MKDFHVAPVEQPEESEPVEGGAPQVAENPLDRFRRISKLVASQSANIKWNEVIKCATIEAHSQIGRCRNRESFKNQQNLLRAMEQARKLIEKAPAALSPSHSFNYDVMDQTNQTLVQLLKNISEEINEISPANTLRVEKSGKRSTTPLAGLNAQLQSLISKTPSPYQTKMKSKTRSSSPKPPTLNLRSGSSDGSLSPSQKSQSESPKPPFIVERPKTPLGKPTSILKNRSSTPDSGRSLDGLKSSGSENSINAIPVIEVSDDSTGKFEPKAEPESPKLIDLHVNEVKSSSDESPLRQTSGDAVKVVKRKAPAPLSSQDISVSRPTAPKIQSNQGMIPPPPEAAKPVMQIPLLSTTPATPLLPLKPMMIVIDKAETPELIITNEAEVEPSKGEPEKIALPEPEAEPPADQPAPAMIVPSLPQPYSSTEQLMTNTDSSTSRAPSPVCLRAVNKIEDVKTIKRQTKTGWL